MTFARKYYGIIIIFFPMEEYLSISISLFPNVIAPNEK